MPSAAATQAEQTLIHVLWLNAGLSCDGDSVSLSAATQPSIEEIALGALPGLPQVAVHWPLIDFECGPTGGADDLVHTPFLRELRRQSYRASQAARSDEAVEPVVTTPPALRLLDRQ